MNDWHARAGAFAIHLDVSISHEQVTAQTLLGRSYVVPGREVWTVKATDHDPLHPRRRIWHPATEREAQRLVEILAMALPDIWNIETPRTLPGWMLVRLAGEIKRWKGYAAA